MAIYTGLVVDGVSGPDAAAALTPPLSPEAVARDLREAVPQKPRSRSPKAVRA
ncbi:hypothetical protein [Xanthobacter dioxanivorans]|uniref:hypothetical protein n=1 Tax=Xanthobacter dioxanivorans TaxID=2528964 RepID=UPI002FD69C43